MSMNVLVTGAREYGLCLPKLAESGYTLLDIRQPMLVSFRFIVADVTDSIH